MNCLLSSLLRRLLLATARGSYIPANREAGFYDLFDKNDFYQQIRQYCSTNKILESDLIWGDRVDHPVDATTEEFWSYWRSRFKKIQAELRSPALFLTSISLLFYQFLKPNESDRYCGSD